MRTAVLLALSLCCTFGCDRSHTDENNTPKEPEYRGGGPVRNEPPMVIEPAAPAPSGSAATELPGMPSGSATGPATESNGGTGAGATGSKGEGETLHNGLNPKKGEDRPDQQQKKVDLAPGKPHPKP